MGDSVDVARQARIRRPKPSKQQDKKETAETISELETQPSCTSSSEEKSRRPRGGRKRVKKAESNDESKHVEQANKEPKIPSGDSEKGSSKNSKARKNEPKLGGNKPKKAELFVERNPGEHDDATTADDKDTSSKSKSRNRKRYRKKKDTAKVETTGATESLSSEAIELIASIQKKQAHEGKDGRMRKIPIREFMTSAKQHAPPPTKNIMELLTGQRQISPEVLFRSQLLANARPPVPGFPSRGYSLRPELFQSAMEALTSDPIISKTRYRPGYYNEADSRSGSLISRLNFSPMYPIPINARSGRVMSASSDRNREYEVYQRLGFENQMTSQNPNHGQRHSYVPKQEVHVPRNRQTSVGHGDARKIAPIVDGNKTSGSTSNTSLRQRKQLFTPYLSLEDVAIGLVDGDLHKGTIRVNQRNFEESYVDNPDGNDQLDILILGFRDRNRALHGDVVVVRFKDRSHWVVRDNLYQAWRNGSLDVSRDDNGQPLTIPPAPRPLADGEVQVAINGLAELSFTRSSLMSDGGTNTARTYSRDQMLLIGAQLETARSGRTDDVPPSCSFTCKPSGEVQSTIDDLSIRRAEEAPRAPTPPRNNAAKSRKGTLKFLFEMPSEDWGMPDYCLQKTAEVVHIAEKKNSRTSAGQLKMMADNNKNWALFSPTDSRMPRMMIPRRDVPQEFFNRPQDFSQFIFLARLHSWEDHCQFAQGKLERQLGSVGDVEAETEGLLYANSVDTREFSHQVLDCLPVTEAQEWTIPEKELKGRRDMREEVIFTIDPKTARDLDDALHIKQIEHGKWEVGVHIADVSYFVHEDTELDKWAASRATSFYLVHKVIPMLPRVLCEQLCSLQPAVDRLTMSVIWTITSTGEILDEWIGRTIIRSKVKLAYEHAQDFIDHPNKEFSADELPSISDGVSVDVIKQKVLCLHEIAKVLRNSREDGGALRLDQPKLKFTLDEITGKPMAVCEYELKESNRLVEEFMLLANIQIAKKLMSTFSETSMLRRHPAPKGKVLRDTVELCSKIGFEVNGASSKEIATSLLRYADHTSLTSKAIHQVLSQLLMKPMQLAVYFCSGTVRNEAECAHYALNVPLYTHFTSPIRRYADVIVHRQLCAALGYSRAPSLSIQELEKQAIHCNDRKLASKAVSEGSEETFFGLFVKEVGTLEDRGVVVNVLDAAFDVLSFKYGVIKRVYTNTFWRLELAREPQYRDAPLPYLTLHWKVDDQGNSSMEQVIQLTSVVDIVFSALPDPPKFGAVIKMKSSADTPTLRDLLAKGK